MDFIKKIRSEEKANVGKSNIQIFDAKQIFAEGCQSVIEYDENVITLQLDRNKARITGFSLSMSNFSREGVYISGDIRSISFDD